MRQPVSTGFSRLALAAMLKRELASMLERATISCVHLPRAEETVSEPPAVAGG